MNIQQYQIATSTIGGAPSSSAHKLRSLDPSVSNSTVKTFRSSQIPQQRSRSPHRNYFDAENLSPVRQTSSNINLKPASSSNRNSSPQRGNS